MLCSLEYTKEGHQCYTQDLMIYHPWILNTWTEFPHWDGGLCRFLDVERVGRQFHGIDTMMKDQLVPFQIRVVR